ncbi:hypothetical protein [Wolbachia endosymbiont (group A) of Beris morrisii]
MLKYNVLMIMKSWIPVSSTGMTSFTMCHIAMFVQLCVTHFASIFAH